MHSSGNIDTGNWVHLFESPCILRCMDLWTSNTRWEFFFPNLSRENYEVPLQKCAQSHMFCTHIFQKMW